MEKIKLKKETPVIILCGGLGTRLREETEYKPKPMIEIGGKPILWHIMKIYSYYGFNNFILALGYKGAIIKDYFLNYKYYNSDFSIELGTNKISLYAKNGIDEKNWKVTLVDTGDQAMTGARIKRCSDFIHTDNFSVTYGDGVSNVKLLDAFNYHIEHNKLVTMLGVNPISRFGEMVIKKNQVIKFCEKPQTERSYVNGGFFFMKKGFLDYLEDNDACVLETTPLEKATSDNQVNVYKHNGFWQCMDTYRDYLHLNNMWNNNNRPWTVWKNAKASL